jgi:hypothetical protein
MGRHENASPFFLLSPFFVPLIKWATGRVSLAYQICVSVLFYRVGLLYVVAKYF